MANNIGETLKLWSSLTWNQGSDHEDTPSTDDTPPSSIVPLRPSQLEQPPA